MYLADDAVSEMGLGRGDLVALAYFLGSDYTEGVSGVGIVNAMEVLEAFPMSPPPSAHPPTANTPTSRNRGISFTESLCSYLVPYGKGG